MATIQLICSNIVTNIGYFLWRLAGYLRGQFASNCDINHNPAH